MSNSELRSCVVRRDRSDPREWLTSTPVCESFGAHHIAHCGIMSAAYPMQIFRDHLSGTFFLSCVDGEGEVLVDGQWQRIRPGQACVQPPFMTNAIRTIKNSYWTFCWVRYKEPQGARPVATTQSPALGAFCSAPFQAVIQGLHGEASETASPPRLQRWVELLHSYVLSFVEPFRADERLLAVWSVVQQFPERNWTLERLARQASMSKEHLRRLTHQSLGRSPMQQVTRIRLQQAAELLVNSDEKITVIAAQVGYENPFAFSDTFQRWIGCRPSVYRKRRSHADRSVQE